MKIVLLSDTHSHCPIGLRAHFEAADEIWHAGDWGNIVVYKWLLSFGKPIRGVFGNIDGPEIQNIFPEDNWFEIEGFSVWITHIGGYPGRYASRVRNILKAKQPNLFICGHSHILKAEKDDKYDMWVLNPGASGIEGFHKMCSAMKFELNKSNLTSFEIIDLGIRGKIKR